MICPIYRSGRLVFVFPIFFSEAELPSTAINKGHVQHPKVGHADITSHACHICSRQILTLRINISCPMFKHFLGMGNWCTHIISISLTEYRQKYYICMCKVHKTAGNCGAWQPSWCFDGRATTTWEFFRWWWITWANYPVSCVTEYVICL
jgi:hypothetical protein